MLKEIFTKFIALWVALFLLSTLALAACGETPPVTVTSANNQTPAATKDIFNEPTATPGRASSQLPPVTITVKPGEDLVGKVPTAIIAPTPTEPIQAPVIQGQPTPSTPIYLPSPTPTPLPPTPAPTATPTPRGAAQKVDAEGELKIIKSAYDAINEHLYKEPNTAELLQAALGEVVVTTGVTLPVVEFGKDKDKNWTIFSDNVKKILKAKNNWEYPKNQLAFRVVNILAQAVGDEHTYFLDKTGYENRQNLLSGNNTSVGFGIVVAEQDDRAVIVRVVKNAPAEKAGIKPGDQIVGYDNTPITGKNWTIIRSAKENETHLFTLKRLNEANPVNINVAKLRYNLPTVEYQMVNGHIGYIAVRDFFLNVADETDKAMTELRKQGADSWIIDVRENPGGVNVELLTGRFVQSGEIMGYNSSRRGQEPMRVSNDLTDGPNKGKTFAPTLPMAVLIDESSASSSEMFALAVRDFKLGPVIGKKSAGALGHTAAYPVGENSAISVTVDVYESKGGEKVNGIGVAPDIEVERSLKDLVEGRDPQLAAGVDYLEKLLAKK